MSERSDSDLAALTLAACRRRVGESFVRPNETGPDVVLVLAAAERGRRDPRASGTGDRPFSLLFRGPADPRLTQGMHDLEHPEFPLEGIFLVPVGREEQGMLYEAVFT